jgi:hypothetical protein
MAPEPQTQDWETWLAAAEADAVYQVTEDGSPENDPPLNPAQEAENQQAQAVDQVPVQQSAPATQYSSR